MKKLVIVSVMALIVTAAIEHKASAWCLFKFGTGINLTLAHGASTYSLPHPCPYPPGLAPMLDGCYPPAPGCFQPLPFPAARPAPGTSEPKPTSPPGKPAAQYFNQSPWGTEYQKVNYPSPLYRDYAGYWYGR